MLLSVLAVCFSLRAAWTRNQRRDAATVMLVAAAVVYIPAMGLRFAGGAWETSVRLVDFLSIGVAFVVGWFPLSEWHAGPALAWRVRRQRWRSRSWLWEGRSTDVAGVAHLAADGDPC